MENRLLVECRECRKERNFKIDYQTVVEKDTHVSVQGTCAHCGHEASIWVPWETWCDMRPKFPSKL